MKKGDKLKVVGFDQALGATIVERTLDDGAIEHSGIITEEQADAMDELPDDLACVSAKVTSPGELVVLSSTPYKGPSRTSNKAFRSGWDNIFGKPKRDTGVN